MKKIFKTMFLCLVAVFAVNANAISSSDKFDGEYSIDYLLRNYDVVTLGMNRVYDILGLAEDINPGDVKDVYFINGSVLVNGSLNSSYIANNEYNSYPAPSYIKRITNNTQICDYCYNRSDIYLGTGNNSYSNPNNLPVAQTDDYIDFEKLYYSILNQQSDMRAIADKPSLLQFMGEDFESSDNSVLFEGNHILNLGDYLYANNRAHYRNVPPLYIELEGNNYVIVNIDDVSVDFLPEIYINDYRDTGYNVIFNFPNARYINLYDDYYYNSISYHIVAPKADIVADKFYYFHGSIIANSFFARNVECEIISKHYDGRDLFNNYITDAKFGIDDINDDLYVGDYSIDEMLRQYNLVVFGKNNRNPASIYHIVGNFLINGNLGKSGVEYGTRYGQRLDARGNNLKYASYVSGNINNNAYVTDALKEREFVYGVWGSGDPMFMLPDWYPSNIYFNTRQNYDYDYVCTVNINGDWGNNSCNWYAEVFTVGNQSFVYRPDYGYNHRKYYYNYISDNYIDFDYLYNNIVEKQAKIKRGDTLTKNSNYEIEVSVGGYYNISSVNDVSAIRFTGFNNNRNNITVITIDQEGEVVMPFESTDIADNIYSNDFYGKNKQMYYYDEIYPEYYYGNIVFSFPNATKVTFAEDNAFKGHIIAPKAAIVMPEMNLAGCVIADSINASGYSELHSYPLTLGDLVYEEPTIDPDPEPEPDPESELGAYAEIKGTLVWADEDDKDAIRPSYVVVHFYADGVEIATKKVYEADNWQFSLEVPVDKEGKVTYTIDNDDVSGYVFDYNETSKYNYEITVSHKIKGVKAEVENPKTGAFNILLLFIPLVILIVGYIYLSKKTVYKKI